MKIERIKSISAEITEIHETEFYTEGVCLAPNGDLYFTNLKGHQICKLITDGSIIEWGQCVHPNGQGILPNGDHLICDCAGEVLRFNEEGEKIEAMASGEINGSAVKVPCDLIIDDYGFYFTDADSDGGMVFYVGFDGRSGVVARDMDGPNGIVISPDGKFLLVAESYRNRIIKIDLEDVGVPSGNVEVFADLPRNPKPRDESRLPTTANFPDGLAYDNFGNLWVAHYGMQAIQILDSTGNLLGTVDTGIPATSNLCFSVDYKSIYVTGGIDEPGPGKVHKLNINYHF